MTTSRESLHQTDSGFNIQLGITQKVLTSQLEGIEIKRRKAAETIRKAIGELATPIEDKLPPRLTISIKGIPGIVDYHYTLIQYDPHKNELFDVSELLTDWTDDGTELNPIRLKEPVITGDAPMDYSGWIKHGNDVVRKLKSSAKTISQGEEVKDIEIDVPDSFMESFKK